MATKSPKPVIKQTRLPCLLALLILFVFPLLLATFSRNVLSRPPGQAMPQHTHDHHAHGHGHEHSHSHSHENVDYGEMYKQAWVQAMVKQIQDYLVANAEWLGIDPKKEQKVLDYACGHGTISLGVLKASPKAICRGIDLDASQAERYNDEANKLLGDEAAAKMVGIQGALYHPSDEITEAEWQNFDMAIISMALHHVQDPVDMLRRLKERLRPGGAVVVVEFLGKEDEPDKPVTESQYDPKDMIEVHSNQRIWPGFTTGSLEADLTKAGFEGFDVRVLDQPAQIPESMRGSFGGEQWPFFAKAMVPGKA